MVKFRLPAPVAQWIEYWPPKPRTAVRACAGAQKDPLAGGFFYSTKLSGTDNLISGYNRLVYHKNIILILAMILCSSCSGNIPNALTAMPDFVTATLPSTLSPQVEQATQIPTQAEPAPSAAAESNISPVEGTTTTQVNVRKGPSTASKSLGLIGPFVKVQVIGKDASGSWYQIIYTESAAGKGWVRAEFLQVNVPAEIPLVETTSSSGAAVSGLVIQKVNVRNGPGMGFELLGVLNSSDVVFITGKDPSGAWIQIEFANAPDGKGWVTAELLQMGNTESVPIVAGAADETATPTDATPTPNAITLFAIQDGDSMQAPLAVVTFSPTSSRTLQVNGDVSAPDGDLEDWIQFTTDSEVVTIQVTCPGNTLRVELWNNEKPVDDLPCGDKSFVTVIPNSSYFLRLSESSVNGSGYTNYILKVEDVR